jgi:KDO2-lipid IV(A) lauroyltransferase
MIALPMSASSSPNPPIALKVRLVLLLLRLGSVVPLGWLHALGAGLGRLMGWVNTREARVARRNAELVGDSLAIPDREHFVRTVMAETGKNLLELARIWGADPERALATIVEIRGLDHFAAARGLGRGLIVAAPHLGCWELLNLWLCRQGPTAILYRQPQHAEWEPLLTRSRGKLQATQIRADAGGVRELLRVLKAGSCVGILPDQRAKGGEGVVAPFFGHPVRSMTLLSRVAARTGVPVVFGFCERLPGGRGFRLHFLPADPDIASTDHGAAVAALHRGLEACVRLAPLQYQWTYKRFSMQPEDPHCAVYDRLR